jgi:hypothetical protein
MAKAPSPHILEILKRYGIEAREALWDCHGTWVMYHRHCEIIGAKAGVKYAEPKVLVAERDAAAVLVMGTIGDHTEWSIGEAAVGLNYTVKPKQPGYPFAMAEKRAKDRVILKLVGLSGFVYSEEEADDFKGGPLPDKPIDARSPHALKPVALPYQKGDWTPGVASGFTKTFLGIAQKLPSDKRQEHYRLNEPAIMDMRAASPKAVEYLNSKFAEIQ